MVATRRGTELAYDPWDPAVMADPYPYYEALRADGGCHELPELDMWVLSTYDLVSGALRDHRTFSSVGGVSRDWPVEAEPARWIGEDPPGHTATRALAAPVFRRAAMSAHEPAVRASAEATVAGFVDAGGGEVVSELAQPIAVQALCEVLGVPNQWPDAMAVLSEDTFVTISARSRADHVANRDIQFEVGIALSKVIEAQLDREVEDPAASVLDMITAHAGEDAGYVQLDEYGRAVYLTVLVSPGVETTRSMITNAVELAARHPDAWETVRSGAVTASAFVSEVLRYETPIQGFFRATTREVEMGGVTIPARARVLCLYGSANRDESAFEDAATFRPGRTDGGRHLAYGAGIHRCIGATLAEIEGVTAIDALAERAAGFEVVDAVRRTDMAQLRNFGRLEVRVTPAG